MVKGFAPGGNGLTDAPSSGTVTVTCVSIPVDTRAPTGQTNAYLLGDDDAVLVDPAGVTDALDTAVTERSVAHIAVTHTHPDHVAGVAEYADRTDATVWARATHAQRFATATGYSPDRYFRDGTVIPADSPVTVRALPGHAPDHVGFVLDSDARSVAVIGDVAVAEGSVVVGGDDGDMRAYFTSLRRLIAGGFDTLYPGHGPAITDPSARLTELLAHRRTRERRVEEAVQSGRQTLEAIVTAAYEKDLTGVEDLARATVAAHLEKLAVEGRVRWDGETATPVPR